MPVGYFRAFTYQPFAFNPQSSPNPYLSYSSGKPFQPNSLYSYGKTVPGPSAYGQVPSHSIPQPPNPPSVPTVPPTQATQQQTTQQQQQQQPSSQSPSIPSTTSTSGPQPILNDVQPPTIVPPQFVPNPQLNSAPIRPMPFVPEPVNLQYITNVAPVPLQQVQFVPCMCPVAVSISTGINNINPELIANKRSDDNIQIPSDYRDALAMGEQSMSEEI